jgi:protein-S-isoprenylcysteine O-methyltransferase Ste14
MKAEDALSSRPFATNAMNSRFVIQFAPVDAFLAALLFWPAGTLDWPGAWVFLGEMVVGGAAICLWLARHDPDLLRERMSGVFQKSQAPADKIFMAFVQVAFCGWLVLMALDAERWRLSHMPTWLNVVGAVLSASFFFSCWLVFRENSFAAPIVKIQKERGQRVVTTGPYRIVRHPMYFGGILYFFGLPLLLGSWIGLTFTPILVAALTLRIGIEERALTEALPDYADYARRVRYRLIPGVW